MLLSLIGSIAIALSGGWSDTPGAVPEINLSAMRPITCDEGTGSGFMIDRDKIVTAYHIAGLTNCFDSETGNKLTRTYVDEHRDFAMMKGTMPDIPPLKIDCGGYEKGRTYYAYGYSSYGQSYRIFRQNTVVASGKYSGPDMMVGGIIKDGKEGVYAMPGMAHLNGYTVPGMSGGYVGHDTGSAVGMVNVGEHTPWGTLTGNMHSYEFKNTILCKKP